MSQVTVTLAVKFLLPRQSDSGHLPPVDLKQSGALIPVFHSLNKYALSTHCQESAMATSTKGRVCIYWPLKSFQVVC